MKADNGQRTLTCESCGNTFGCCPAPDAGCWCRSVNVSVGTLEDLKSKYAECICPACLAEYAQKEPVTRS